MESTQHLHPSLTRDLATITHLAAATWLSDFIDADGEAGQLAADMVEQGLARLELVTAFDPQRPPAHRLLLVPLEEEGEPVEVAVVGCPPVVPTPEATAARIWFFGRLSHWQPKH